MEAKSEKYTVYDALYMRIKNVFKNNVRVYFSFSGGKDSLVIANALAELIEQGQIDGKMLSVIFIDEEAIYPCVEKIVRHWRKRFMLMGAKFYWVCLPIKHHNCVNMLSSDMSFICWDPKAKDRWVRDMPAEAITDHPDFKDGMTYQEFMDKLQSGIQIVGLRVDESLHRRQSIQRNGGVTYAGKVARVYPIYDWGDNDVFLYLWQKGVTLPDAYINMWKTGRGRRRLRMSQFFSVDTMPSLVSMMEYYPALYERILKREPNAYIAALYYDTEMFRRSSSKRKSLEGDVDKDWRKAYHEAVTNDKYKVARRNEIKLTRNIILQHGNQLGQKEYKKMYEIVVAGDPKNRSIRALMSHAVTQRKKRSEKD